jgi:VCBS repeat-containing protein
VQVTDAGGLTDTATVTVDLTNVNEAPSLADASFSLPENSANGTLVGSRGRGRPRRRRRPRVRDHGRQRGRRLRDRPDTGAITVADAAALDFETTPSFALTVQVTDAGGLTDTATVTVDLTNVNEAPSLADASFSLPENSANGTLVGTVAATDPDAGDTRSYAITGGNTGGAFAIDPTTGAITVANSAALDFETTPGFALTVQVTDAGGLTDTATVTVDLTNVNEAPSLADASFSLPENSAAGTLRRQRGRHGSRCRGHPRPCHHRRQPGRRLRHRPDDGRHHGGQRRRAGLRDALGFALTVEVTDAGGLTDTATVTVGLTDVNEPPVLADASFSLPENSAAGALVGTLVAVDPDAGDAVRYAITGGNAGGAFAIDPSTGAITVANTAALDFDTTPSFVLTVEAADASGAAQTATITVNLRELRLAVDAVELQEPPVLDPEESEDERPVEALVIPPTPRTPEGPVPPPTARLDGPGERGGTGLAQPRPLPEIWQAPEAEDGSVRDHSLAAVEQPGMIDQRRLLEALDRLRQDLTAAGRRTRRRGSR